ncbi:uncharacterized protein A4U43_C02F7700 [Asparagus officinalis]|uniref:Late embryogenesis abundant protein LEA-2 subgroup domain-containing protein n=1 Tax=Asparagus officinalis TaxID=4686 RepID=A0A5P1FGR3_ASPOF|nr:NDR1/HIN1-like protein 3 [Asparagus officinalis]ONK77546.1 uncharacterized protein A4U43_C02F7700 [Asparagus officinalis]
MVFILWIIYRPKTVRAHVTAVFPSVFTLTSNSTLVYNFTLHVSIQNPNRKVGLYYDDISAEAQYDSIPFGLVYKFPPFFQHKRNITVFPLVFVGRAFGLRSVQKKFEREKREGWFYVELKICTKMRLKIEFVKVGRYSPEIDCAVKLPVMANGSDVKFERSECDVDKF